MKLFLFLRDIIWTSVLALLLIVASIVIVLVTGTTAIPVTFALSAIALATLSKSNG
jgi:hypothetical protein